MTWQAIATNQSYIGFAMMLAGVAFIVWNERRRTERLLEQERLLEIERRILAIEAQLAPPIPTVTDNKGVGRKGG